ncbi:MAG: sigma-70 family RNA polymerase sigma factor [Clostridia bacterium]|nr:sigma-70 family RNA polymerase sigma factor [Clostridia bacterium]
MGRRVVICGIDTSTLPRLTAKEAVALMEKVKQGDKGARNRFIMCNIRLVLSVVQRYVERCNSPDDLFQVGCVGLIKSVDNFDNTLNVKFSTYAVPMIVGEIRRFLRESNSLRVSRGIRDVAYVALQARDEIERNNEVATVELVAKKINKTIAEVVFALDAISHPISLFEPVYSDGIEAVLVMDQISDVKNTDENWIKRISLAEAVVQLNDRERSILKKRYYEGKTQIEVSAEVGISQAQVSRLEKNAVKRIREYV